MLLDLSFSKTKEHSDLLASCFHSEVNIRNLGEYLLIDTNFPFPGHKMWHNSLFTSLNNSFMVNQGMFVTLHKNRISTRV